MYNIPTSITIQDKSFGIRNKGDYRVVLDCFSALNDTELSDQERMIAALIIFYEDINSIDDINNIPDIELAIKEMYRQTGPCIFNKDGIIQKGVIVRHLILPGYKKDSKKIINYLYNEYHDNIYLSIMNQYTPNKEIKDNILKRNLSKKDYNEIIDYAFELGINNAFCQIDGTVSESFIPNFNFEGIKKEVNK